MARIFLSGASGNVGKALVREIAADGEFELAGGWCLEAGEDLGTLAGIAPLGVKASASLEEGVAASKPDIVVEFSAAAVMESNLECYLRLGADAVIGTTGLKPDKLAELGARAVSQGLRWSALPNYALGINLVAKFLREAREYYPYASVTDRIPRRWATRRAVLRRCWREFCPSAKRERLEARKPTTARSARISAERRFLQRGFRTRVRFRGIR